MNKGNRAGARDIEWHNWGILGEGNFGLCDFCVAVDAGDWGGESMDEGMGGTRQQRVLDPADMPPSSEASALSKRGVPGRTSAVVPYTVRAC